MVSEDRSRHGRHTPAGGIVEDGLTLCRIYSIPEQRGEFVRLERLHIFGVGIHLDFSVSVFLGHLCFVMRRITV